MADLEKLKYPIGKFQKPSIIDTSVIENWIQSIEELPVKVIGFVEGLGNDELSKPYRPDGWTIQEVVHHIPDSHLNAYVRLKWALTEDTPSIKAYNEKAWAALSDSQTGDVQLSLNLLNTLHARWVYLLKSLTEDQLKRAYFHPDDNETVSIEEFIGRYAWHGEHHLAHLKQALENKF